MHPETVVSGYGDTELISCTLIPDSDRSLSSEQAEEIAILLSEVPSRAPIVEGDDAEKTAVIQQR